MFFNVFTTQSGRHFIWYVLYYQLYIEGNQTRISPQKNIRNDNILNRHL